MGQAVPAQNVRGKRKIKNRRSQNLTLLKGVLALSLHVGTPQTCTGHCVCVCLCVCFFFGMGSVQEAAERACHGQRERGLSKGGDERRVGGQHPRSKECNMLSAWERRSTPSGPTMEHRSQPRRAARRTYADRYTHLTNGYADTIIKYIHTRMNSHLLFSPLLWGP